MFSLAVVTPAFGPYSGKFNAKDASHEQTRPPSSLAATPTDLATDADRRVDYYCICCGAVFAGAGAVHADLTGHCDHSFSLTSDVISFIARQRIGPFRIPNCLPALRLLS